MQESIKLDQVIDRRNTNCAKWDTMDQVYHSQDLIHLGVADMDFKAPQSISDAFQSCVDHGIYGYTDINEGFYEAIIRWFRDKNHTDVKKEEILFCPRISISVSLAVETYTNPGEEVIIHTPSYDALYEGIVKNHRVAVESPLIIRDGKYTIDFDELETLVSEKTKMYILCSPFNPVSRVWDREELEKIGAFCVKHKLLLYVDEIHGDFTAPGIQFTTALQLADEVRDRLIVASSPTKTFNVPGVIVSYLIIPNGKYKKMLEEDIHRLGMNNPNIFAVAAVEQGYRNSDDWYDAVLTYIDENDAFTREYFGKHFPEFQIFPREGTYLLWISYEALGCSEDELKEWFIREAGVEVYMGTKFGEKGLGYFRLNLGTTRKMLSDAFERMRKAYPLLKK
ncbi:MAG: pyridoxal phosphate-dependent aminotransferase [Lachnospiraceae bacterium]|nr:pyridoxal phosphate-dependent aminotransferase [Lachnospiraceae bacterium]